MQDDLVNVYEAENLFQAQMLADRLGAAGIKSFIDNTDSPLDGLTAADQMNIVRVLPSDVEAASRLVAEFVAEAGSTQLRIEDERETDD